MSDLSQCSLLIVDDTPANIDILVETLGETYEICVATDGKGAMEALDEILPDLILLDIMMPDISGYDVCKQLKSSSKTKDIPIIFLTALNDAPNEEKGLRLGAVDYIVKPFNPALVQARVKNNLLLKKHNDNIQNLVKERTKQLELTQEITMECMGTLAEYRDPETGGHIKRTKNYVRVLAKKLQEIPKFVPFLTNETIELLFQSAPLHDIGKVGIPDHILLKPGKLTDEEFEIMKQHTVYGRDVIRQSEKRLGSHSFLYFAREIAGSHQEKWNGSGYPDGLSGEEIPISGRIMAIADVYDALISKRVYKPPFKHSKAVKIIKEGCNTHFDPDMVNAFLKITEQFREIAILHADFQEEKEALLK